MFKLDSPVWYLVDLDIHDLPAVRPFHSYYSTSGFDGGSLEEP